MIVGGVCYPADGTCSQANKADGTPCDDGNPATANDVCTAGVGVGVDLCAGVSCDSESECQEAGVCNHADGSCSSANKPDGTPCSGGTCMAGVCVEEDPDGGVEEPDAEPDEDAGVDAGEGEDAGVDGGDDPDAGETDAGDEDADVPTDDAGLEDASTDPDPEDAGAEDAGEDAAAPGDAAADGSDGIEDPGAGEPDVDAVSEAGGCGCRTAGGSTSTPGALAALALVGAVVARRRRG